MGASTILWALGILATLASMTILFTSRPYRGGVITTGTVVQMTTEHPDGPDYVQRQMVGLHAPVVQFTDQAGVTHTITSKLSGGRAPVIGSTRLVSYLPAEPAKARIVATRQTIIPIVLFLVVGLGCLVGAVATK